ncbi:MAG: hypothetical protein PVG54_06800 [Anaerolineae bacterium]
MALASEAAHHLTIAGRAILRGVERNEAIITVTSQARLVWWLYRLSPDLLITVFRKLARDIHALRAEQG